MRGGGEQPGRVQGLGQFRPAAVRKPPQLHIAARGEMQVAVTEPPRRLRERLGLADGQDAARDPYAGQRPVVRGVQPERPRAGVTAVSWGRCGLGG